MTRRRRRSGRAQGSVSGRRGLNDDVSSGSLRRGEGDSSVGGRLVGVFGLFVFALLVFLAPVSAGAQEQEEASTGSVWYADGSSLVRVDANSGKASGSVSLPSNLTPASGLASHPTDGSVAVLAKGHLLGFDASGKQTFDRALEDSAAASSAGVLASDPQDGSLWVGAAVFWCAPIAALRIRVL